MFDKMVTEAKVEELITPGSKTETLNAIFLPVVPKYVLNFFNFMQDHIKLNVTDVSMGGSVSVRFKENRSGLSSLMEKEGYEYAIYRTFVDEFEDKILEQHYDALDKN